MLTADQLLALTAPAPGMAERAEALADLFDRLFPIMRSITGKGVRESMHILSEVQPLDLIEIPSGTEAFDWTVPKEWVFRTARLTDPDGNVIIDAADHTLHVLNYSAPFKGNVSRAELDEHLYSLPDQPDAIPYVTSYYAERWGLCLSENRRRRLPDGNYRVEIDTEFIDGTLTIGECVLPGENKDEVLISTNICHPSLANNELSGPLVTAFLARQVAAWPRRRLTYRFVFLPETIGSLTYLAREGERLKEHMVAGYQIVCVGTDRPFLFKQSRREDSLADRAALTALRHRFGNDVETRRFAAHWGSDERQYCSPGFDLPLGSIIRSIYDEYPEYHTSLDNRDFVSFPAMAETVEVCEFVLKHIDLNATYINRRPHGELQLGKRGLYPTLGNYQDNMDQVAAILWLLNLSDGKHDLIAVAERSGVDIRLLDHYAALFHEMGILETP